MRLFFAVELDSVARRRIGAEQRRLKSSLTNTADLRWVDPDQIHLTLVFLGEVVTPALESLLAVAAQAIPIKPFTMTFAGVGMFPPRGAPRVLWLGTLDGAAEAGAVQQIVAGRAAGCGIAIEQRPFKPHLTLARVRGRRGAGRLGRRFGETIQPRKSAIAYLDVTAVTLFQSTPSPSGSVYAALARAPLV